MTMEKNMIKGEIEKELTLIELGTASMLPSV